MNYNETEQTNGGSEYRTGAFNYINLKFDKNNKVKEVDSTNTIKLLVNPNKDAEIGENPIILKLEKTVIKEEEPNK